MTNEQEPRGADNERIEDHLGELQTNSPEPGQIVRAIEVVPPVRATREAWYLEEHEMVPEQLQRLGYLVYRGVFGGVRQGERDDRLETAGFGDADETPAEAYVRAFARDFGVEESLLLRWTETAARQVASAALPVFEHEQEEQRKLPHYAEDYVSVEVEMATKVQGEGLKADVGSHSGLLCAVAGFELARKFAPKDELWRSEHRQK